MYKIRTYNAISSKGLSRFPTDRYEVSSESTDAEGILLRSQKLHTEVMPESVVAIAALALVRIIFLLLITLRRALSYSILQAPMPTR